MAAVNLNEFPSLLLWDSSVIEQFRKLVLYHHISKQRGTIFDNPSGFICTVNNGRFTCLTPCQTLKVKRHFRNITPPHLGGAAGKENVLPYGYFMSCTKRLYP